jgi:hypothetical protein
MTLPVVPFEEMRSRLLTLDDTRERLRATEPLTEVIFHPGDGVNFRVEPGWNTEDTDNYAPVAAHVQISGGEEYQLSRLALLEAGALVGVPRHKQEEWPAAIMQTLLNWWFREKSDRDHKLLIRGGTDGNDSLALATCRATITPFSNLHLLEIALQSVDHQIGAGTEVLVDYKFSHSLEWTTMRLIVPELSRLITGTRDENDQWCGGIDVQNSLTGIYPTRLQGYAFRWWCTNGETTDLAQTAQFSRKGSYDAADVWAWARTSVDEILGGLNEVFDGVQRLTESPVNGDAASVTSVLNDLFARYNIPMRERQRVIAGLANLPGDITMYDLMQEVTRAANMEGLPIRAVRSLLALGGHMAEAGTERCNEEHPCRRLLPPDFQPARSRIQQNPDQN